MQEYNISCTHFFYIHSMRREGFVKKMQVEHPEVNWFLDCGSYTYFAALKYKKELPKPEKYVERYFDYIDRYGHRFCRVAEPDLDVAFQDITFHDVNNWREQMLKVWPDLPITPVWQGTRGPLEWEKICLDPRIRHTALGSGHSDPGMLALLVNRAHRANKTVHGFAMTRMKIFDYVHFDSVDSTSWVSGQKFGTLYVWRGNKFVTLPSYKKEERKFYRSYYKRIGVDWKLIIEDDVAEVRRCNVVSWRLLSEKLQEARKRHLMALAGEEIPTVERGQERGIVSALFAAPKEREPDEELTRPEER